VAPLPAGGHLPAPAPRSNGGACPRRSHGGFTFEHGKPPFTLAARTITRDGAEVKLTPTEWHLVEMLVRNAGKLVSQRQLLQEVWGPEYERETNYLRVYLARVRRKLEIDPSNPEHFITEPGVGYRFRP